MNSDLSETSEQRLRKNLHDLGAAVVSEPKLAGSHVYAQPSRSRPPSRWKLGAVAAASVFAVVVAGSLLVARSNQDDGGYASTTGVGAEQGDSPESAVQATGKPDAAAIMPALLTHLTAEFDLQFAPDAIEIAQREKEASMAEWEAANEGVGQRETERYLAEHPEAANQQSDAATPEDDVLYVNGQTPSGGRVIVTVISLGPGDRSLYGADRPVIFPGAGNAKELGDDGVSVWQQQETAPDTGLPLYDVEIHGQNGVVAFTIEGASRPLSIDEAIAALHAAWPN